MISRRQFVRSGAAAVLAFPYIVRSSALGNSAVPSAANRITLGHIGLGGQGTELLKGFMEVAGCQSVAVSDCFADRRAQAAQRIDEAWRKRNKGAGGICKTYADFRELLARPDIDAVVIATPDHWHVPAAFYAVQAGKDIYVEKPLGLSIEQNKTLRRAMRRYGRVFQYGTQQRSFQRHCAFACELVRNGFLGEIKQIRVEAPAGLSGGSVEPMPVPEGFDYDTWLGPARYRPYTKDRCTKYGSFHCYDNSIGYIAGWGAHPLDVMHWGFPHIPVEYEGTGVIPREGLFSTITNWDIKGRFACSAEFVFTDGPDNTTFVGNAGWVRVSRGDIDAGPKSLLKERIRPGQIRLFRRGNHYQDFIDSVKRRIDGVSGIDSAVQSDIVSHLGDIAVRLGRKIRWDAEAETVIGDEQARRMMTRPMRSPWSLLP